MGSIQTHILFKTYKKALDICAEKKGLYFTWANKAGSARSMEFFTNRKGKGTPVAVLVVHESKYLYSDDLKKTCKVFKMSLDQFRVITDSL